MSTTGVISTPSSPSSRPPTSSTTRAPSGPLEGVGYRGREGVERFAVDTSENWEELQNIPEEFRDLGNRVLVLFRLRGRGKASGAPVDQPCACILDFRGDRIWRNRVYLDRAEGMRVAGLPE
jgi:ketosteroid isomerase-like protein